VRTAIVIAFAYLLIVFPSLAEGRYSEALNEC
jgi:hypothetical protein